MGTNYYLHKNACQCCNRSEVRLHIGKSSHGWCFSLHIDQFEGIEDLPDWEKLFTGQNNTITDEYGAVVTAESMLSIITQRAHNYVLGHGDVPCILSPLKVDDPLTWNEYYERNQAEPGPNNLLRHRIDPNGYHCVRHGAGTWDCIRGEFS